MKSAMQAVIDIPKDCCAVFEDISSWFEALVWRSTIWIQGFSVSGGNFKTSPYVTATLVFHSRMGRIEKFGHFVEAASMKIAEAPLDVCLEMDTKFLV